MKASVANLPQVGQPGFVIVVFDTDRNGSTGSLLGGDYLLVFDLGSASGGLRRWSGTGYCRCGWRHHHGHRRRLIRGEGEAGVAGGATAFDFAIAAGSGEPGAAEIDIAPDVGMWFYG